MWGIFEQLPYVNMHNLNLDWLLKKVKANETSIEALKAVEQVNNTFNIIVIDGVTTTTTKEIFEAFFGEGKILQLVVDGIAVNDGNVTRLSNGWGFTFRSAMAITTETETAATLTQDVYSFAVMGFGTDTPPTITKTTRTVSVLKEV